MEIKTFGLAARRSAVQPVSHDRMSRPCQMNADLMGAAGVDFDGESAVFRRGLQRSHVADRISAGRDDCHSRAMSWVAADWRFQTDPAFDLAAFAELGRIAVGKRLVRFANLPLGEAFCKSAVGVLGFGDHNDPACESVEPVNDSGSQVAA